MQKIEVDRVVDPYAAFHALVKISGDYRRLYRQDAKVIEVGIGVQEAYLRWCAQDRRFVNVFRKSYRGKPVDMVEFNGGGLLVNFDLADNEILLPEAPE